METDTTFGFDSARQVATEAIDRLHTTAQSHHRVMIVEVTGRNAGWLALESGIAGGGDVILIPEPPYELDEIVRIARQRSRFGKRFSIVVVAEGAKPEDGQQVIDRIVTDSPEKVRLGGIGHQIAHQIEEATDIECRVAQLGHLQRGGTPSAADRILATRLAVRSMELVAEGKFNHMVAINGDEIAGGVAGQRGTELDQAMSQLAAITSQTDTDKARHLRRTGRQLERVAKVPVGRRKLGVDQQSAWLRRCRSLPCRPTPRSRFRYRVAQVADPGMGRLGGVLRLAGLARSGSVSHACPSDLPANEASS